VPVRRKSLVAAGFVLIAASAVGCSGSSAEDPESSPVPTPTPTPLPIDPAELLERSGELMQGLSSFRFRINHEGGGTQLFEGMDILEAEGEVVSPDRISLASRLRRWDSC